MKKTMIIFLTGFMLSSCLAMTPRNPVCPQEGSWICEQSEKLNIQPETVYGWIYTASAVAAISDVIEIKEICDFERDVASHYVRMWPMSYSSFIDAVIGITDSMPREKMILIKNIINRNLIQYRSPELVSEADDIILRKGHVAFRRDMACYDD